jgi:hypothetical protein
MFSHPDYNPSTLLIPEAFLKEQTPGKVILIFKYLIPFKVIVNGIQLLRITFL